MDCQRTREQLGLLLDGELAFALSRTVLGHLGECPECRAELDLLRSIGAQIRSEPLPKLGSLRARILSEAAVMPEPQRLTFAFVWPRAAAMLLGAVTVALSLASQKPVPQVEPSGAISRLDRVTLESQIDLELAGSLASDFRELGLRPEVRLMFEVAEDAR